MNRLDVRALGWVVTRDALSEMAHVAFGARRRIPRVALGQLGDRWRAVHASPAADQPELLVAFLVGKFTTSLSKQSEKQMITVLLPEFVPAKWWHQLLHNQSSLLLKGALLFQKGVIVTSVPYHLE